ncbi:MAG: 16S rRNA (guanine(527)-N(7))-methyltransferase RsmG [Bdellovibrionales bacterium]|nr:16S rRNA (guanine(527)-N(7))-methyltransferase RsmG [Bdellovibrionales bacterium]NQZ19105.1 16S rRNA (guanine(527)-N(7))-methyltransferase RsmG [Bdellovibrionales bacterium]
MAHKNTSNWSPYKGQKKGPLRGRHKKPQRIFKFGEADDRLRDIFVNHGFDHKIDHKTRHQFVRFYQLLMENQKKQNFTRLTSIKDIGIKHFVDCMMVNKLIPLKFPLLDMGTGPGFPGIPLKIIVGQEKKIILAEGVQKRVSFLKKVREELKLENLDIIGRNITDEFEYPVQGVITRAVEDAQNTLGNVINCLQTGGCVYLMKGPNVGPEIEVALKKWGDYYKLEKDRSYTLPNTPHERRLVVFRKTKSLERAEDDQQ